MIDKDLIMRYKWYNFIGSGWKSGYNFSDRYMLKYDTDSRQYYIFPAGRALNRIYSVPKGTMELDEIRTIVGCMLAYEDTDLPQATREAILSELPAEIQNYLKEHEAPEPEPEQPAVYTAIKTTDEQQAATEVYTAIKTDKPEPAEQKPKHKGGRPRTREKTGRRYIRLWINDEEHAEIKKLIAKLRGKS